MVAAVRVSDQGDPSLGVSYLDDFDGFGRVETQKMYEARCYRESMAKSAAEKEARAVEAQEMADNGVRRRGWHVRLAVAERAHDDARAVLLKEEDARADLVSKRDAARQRLDDARKALSASVDALATETTPKAVQKHAATAAEIVALESMIPVLERRIVEAEPRIARATAAIREPRLIHEGATHAVEAAELAPLEIERRAHEAEAARLRAEAERSDEKAREVLQQMRAAANDKAWEYDVLAIVGVAADAIEAARQPRQAAE